MRQQLVIGNATTEYTYQSSVDSFSPKVLNKRHAESTRTAWLLHEGDAMLTDRPLTPEFLQYLERVLGLDLRTVTFLTHDKNASGSEFLDHPSLFEPGMLERLRQIVGPDWSLTPYIHDRTIATLGRRLGLDDEANPPFFAEGGSDIFNSKSFFRAWSSGLGVPVPRGQVTRNRAATAAAVAELLPETGSVIVKQDFSASGMGNVLFTTDGELPGIGVSIVHVIAPGTVESEIDRLLAESFPTVEQARDFPAGLRPTEAVVEVYYGRSLTFYSEVHVPAPPKEPEILNWGGMRMEPVWNGFELPPLDLPRAVEADMLMWSAKMASYLQTTGYRGLVNCDSILTPDGTLYFSEVNARVGGCTHLHHAAVRVLGPDYMRKYTLLTRNDLPCRDFTALAKAIDGDPLLSGEDGRSGALLLVDDTPYNEVVQYLVYGSSVELAQEAERRLRNLPR
ncbi:preATP grasp domain-containing protein [Streptomyces buecherae]|uniref:preATP grasp domain-containing protein n=1 Tax=Streptomyces buecherae TaxID=2763006 RepID=UPI003796D5CE